MSECGVDYAWSLDELLDLMKNKPENVELILTGRWPGPRSSAKPTWSRRWKEVKHITAKGSKAG